MKKNVFIVWNIFQRRVLSMQNHFGYETIFIAPFFKTKYFKIFDYAAKSFRTFLILIFRRPNVLWIQLPPVPLLYLAVCYKFLCFQQVNVIADCHNLMIKPFWLKWPLCLWCLKQMDWVLVHNEEVEKDALNFGINKENMLVLEDRPAEITNIKLGNSNKFSHPFILFPSSFSPDEPIEEVLGAAQFMPEIQLFLSGNKSRAEGNFDISDVPDNVTFTGFLSVDDFNELLCEADAVMGFTKFEGIQLSVCNEALGVEKPMVLSDTQLLRNLFGKAAVFVNSNDPKSIADGCRNVIKDRDALAREAKKLKSERISLWTQQAGKLQLP